MKWSNAVAVPAAAVAAVASYDLLQRRHALLRNFPVVGHGRYLLEAIGPELRQYIITGNDEERPFSRDQRRWVYASSKRENNYFGFGTDNDIEYTDGYTIIKHRTFSRAAAVGGPARRGSTCAIPSAKVLGARPGPGQGVPAGLDRQHLGDELRVAVGRGDHGAQPGCRGVPAACTTPARAGSRRTTAAAAT